MKVVLASTNKAKALATKKVFATYFHNMELITLQTESGVSKTPMSDNEGIKGCLNRIESIKRKMPGAQAYVGLEGIITKNTYGSFLCGWAVVELVKEKKIGIGCSAKVKIPDSISNNVSSFSELRDLVKNSIPSELVHEMDEIGSNGVFTNKMYTRTDEFEDAILCALGFGMTNND